MKTGFPIRRRIGLLLLKRIVASVHSEYGIPRENVIIDCLTLTVSAQQKEVSGDAEER